MKKRYYLYGLLALVVLISATWAFRYLTAPIRGSVNAEEQLESAASRIARYDYFFDLCASVQRQKAQLAAQKERLSSEPDGKIKSRVRANIAGIKSQVAGSVAQYNAESAKSYTSARFKASNLPYQLTVEGETQCVTY